MLMNTHDGAELDRAPKLCGADAELGNLIRGLPPSLSTGAAASQLLLREIPGIAHVRRLDAVAPVERDDDDDAADDAGPRAAPRVDPQDRDRRFLPSNGGCAYIDLNHLEICTPETRSAMAFVAAWHAMLLVARQAMDAVNAWVDPRLRVQVLVNNSDGRGNSYGSHLNFLLTRRAWSGLFHRKAHHLAYLASYQASSVVVAGQGKVGAENGAPAVEYQLSQRADFFQRIVGSQTTFDRPLVNSRDESLCGTGDRRSAAALAARLARLHCIFYDSNLCHVACLLKVAGMQMILACLEAERVNPALILDDPLEAVRRYSHDPSLRATARMASGKRLTAVELQLLFVEEAQRFLDQGGFEGIVPGAGECLALWADTLDRLRAGDWHVLTRRLDWVLKRSLLERTMRQRPGLSWESPEIKLLDHVYSSLDPDEGLYWICEKAGATERVASPAQVERFFHEPPIDTRAYARATLLRLAGPEQVDRVDWDSIRFRLADRNGWPIYRTLDMADPAGWTQTACDSWLGLGLPLDMILDGLTGEPRPAADGAQPTQ